MRTYMRIEEGKVVEFFSTDGNMKEMFHPSLVWVDISGVTPAPIIGSVLKADGTFSAPPIG